MLTTILLSCWEDSDSNTLLHNYWMLHDQVVITLRFSQLVFLFVLRVCTGAYATFSIISRSTTAP